MAYSGNIDADQREREMDSPMAICPECKGKGEVPFEVCHSCHGTGCLTFDETFIDDPCPDCMGEGKEWVDCPLCDGEGEIDEDMADTYVEPIIPEEDIE